MNYWNKWKYKNLTIFVLSIVFALWITRFQEFHELLLGLGEYGYIGAFVAGILFVSTFTVATGAVLILILSERLSLIEIGIIAGAGAVIGDLLIFRLVKDRLIEEVTPIYEKLGGNHIKRVLSTKYFSWTFPVIGAVIIASPLPDELGVSLMGISKIKTYQFVILSFALNSIGIGLVVYLSKFIKP